MNKNKGRGKGNVDTPGGAGVCCAVLCCSISDHSFSPIVTVVNNRHLPEILHLDKYSSLYISGSNQSFLHRVSQKGQRRRCSCCFIPSCSSQWEGAYMATATVQTLLYSETLHCLDSSPSDQPTPCKAWLQLVLCWL